MFPVPWTQSKKAALVHNSLLYRGGCFVVVFIRGFGQTHNRRKLFSGSGSFLDVFAQCLLQRGSVCL